MRVRDLFWLFQALGSAKSRANPRSPSTTASLHLSKRLARGSGNLLSLVLILHFLECAQTVTPPQLGSCARAGNRAPQDPHFAAIMTAAQISRNPLLVALGDAWGEKSLPPSISSRISGAGASTLPLCWHQPEKRLRSQRVHAPKTPRRSSKVSPEGDARLGVHQGVGAGPRG